jgi:sugar O-acyltransferase (sialic acid O-acetyltransferase NeuD family)
MLNDVLESMGHQLVALFDSDVSVVSPFDGIPLYHDKDSFNRWMVTRPAGDLYVAVAIGGAHGRTRRTLGRELMEAGLKPFDVIHPSAVVSRTATMGEGCHVLAGAVLCARAKIGDWCILNTRAAVDHECRCGNGVHIGPGATVTGLVEIEDDAFIGAGAVVLPRIHVGRGAIVGAGAVVTMDVPAGSVVTGIPATFLRQVEASEW